MSLVKMWGEYTNVDQIFGICKLDSDVLSATSNLRRIFARMMAASGTNWVLSRSPQPGECVIIEGKYKYLAAHREAIEAAYADQVPPAFILVDDFNVRDAEATGFYTLFHFNAERELEIFAERLSTERQLPYSSLPSSVKTSADYANFFRKIA